MALRIEGLLELGDLVADGSEGGLLGLYDRRQLLLQLLDFRLVLSEAGRLARLVLPAQVLNSLREICESFSPADRC